MGPNSYRSPARFCSSLALASSCYAQGFVGDNSDSGNVLAPPWQLGEGDVTPQAPSAACFPRVSLSERPTCGHLPLLVCFEVGSLRESCVVCAGRARGPGSVYPDHRRDVSSPGNRIYAQKPCNLLLVLALFLSMYSPGFRFIAQKYFCGDEYGHQATQCFHSRGFSREIVVI